eukprot:gene6328-10335_t
MVLENLVGVPKVAPAAAVICAIINTIFIPGLGTIIAGIFNEGGLNLAAVIIGICQILLFPFGIGIIWAFFSSVCILVRGGSD